MFGFIGSKIGITHHSKNVKKWKKEHVQLGELIGEIVATYDAQDLKKSKKLLLKFRNISLAHLMDEDVSFIDFLEEAVEGEPEDDAIVAEIDEFRASFRGVKLALFDFLDIYASKDTELDDNFRVTFDGIIKALVERIEFEESHLYDKINK